jgi:ferric-dicitrate binding protein FerR (iron transport regulator)
MVLTSESSAKFSRLFRQRTLHLKGKAYLEVEKGNTFLVSTRNGKVEVLGTRFTVDDTNDQLQVICFEGKIKASFDNEEVLLLPGSGITFSQGKKQETITIEEEYPAYARFSKDYSNSGLDEVLKDIEAFFDIRIINRVGQTRYFTGSIHTGNPQTALSIITVSLRLNYRTEEDQTIVVF